MRLTRLAFALSVAALFGWAISATAGIQAGPGEEALFRRILAASDACDAKWLDSYSARFTSRVVVRDVAGETVKVATREGVALVHGKYVSARETEVEAPSENGAIRHHHQVSDGELTAEKLGSALSDGTKLPPKMSLRPADAIGDDPALPMQWMSLGKYWQALHPNMPLADLLTGETVVGGAMLLNGEWTRRSQRVTGLSAREENIAGEMLLRLSLTATNTAGDISSSRTTVFLLDPRKGYRLLRVEGEAGVDSKPGLVRTISLAQNEEGVWYPARVQRGPDPDSRKAVEVGNMSIPAFEGSFERTTEFTEFTANPDIPDDAFAAIPPEGSAARREALRAAGNPRD